MKQLLSICEIPLTVAEERSLVLDLAALDSSMLPVVGGKAANLGELIRAGLPVPPGFCVTTEAYARAAASASIDFDAFASAGPEELQKLAGRARKELLAVAMPAPVASAVLAAYNRLGDTPVAVRSSATAEDLPGASFAGQQDTYLNITGAAAVLDAVQRCWASLWTDRAVVYRSTNGIDHSAVRLAVVVQRMVDAEVAGVLFTANPLTGRRREAVIDASPGLGEAVVSGAVVIREDEVAARVLRDEPVTELARMFHSGSLPPHAQHGLAAFLPRYGHRAVAEIDIGVPRWSDDPSYILGVLSNYLRLDNPELAPDTLFVKGAAEAEEMIETLVNRARRHGLLRSRLVRFTLTRVRQLAVLRETPKYYMIVVLAAARRVLATIGVELAGRGTIDVPDDVFFLGLSEVRSAIHGRNVRDRVAQRREEYQAELRRQVPRVVLSDGTQPETLSASNAETAGLAGTPASAGTVSGIARVVLDPVGAHLEPGEILVAPSTDPGWTPLFLTAGGLVMEMGRANSHGAVVAREYGIPAVVGVPDATVRIATGQRISVNGATGTISLLP